MITWWSIGDVADGWDVNSHKSRGEAEEYAKEKVRKQVWKRGHVCAQTATVSPSTEVEHHGQWFLEGLT